MEKRLLKFEVAGAIFVLVMSVFLQNLYDLCGGALPGIMFGAANESIWEITKTILISYIFWSIIEVMCAGVRFHKFVVARVISLYFLGFFYILLCLVFSALGGENYSMPEFAAAVAAVLSASFLCFKLMNSEIKLEKLFVPALFMMLLFLAIYCSFTPFPPHCFIFMDRATGLYGIIPEYIDHGAIALDAVYNINTF